jgi:hypothetical protein
MIYGILSYRNRNPAADRVAEEIVRDRLSKERYLGGFPTGESPQGIVSHPAQILEFAVSAAGRPDQLLGDVLATFVIAAMLGQFSADLFEHQ